MKMKLAMASLLFVGLNLFGTTSTIDHLIGTALDKSVEANDLLALITNDLKEREAALQAEAAQVEADKKSLALALGATLPQDTSNLTVAEANSMLAAIETEVDPVVARVNTTRAACLARRAEHEKELAARANCHDLLNFALKNKDRGALYFTNDMVKAMDLCTKRLATPIKD